jgi:predicted ATP-dependent endonuclease of OLD family
MKLVSARILNYRSVEDINIDFEYNTKIFVGLSETGKSNLLKALNTLSSTSKTTHRDIREDIESAEKSYIEFLIKLDDEDKEEIKEIIKNRSYNLNFNRILLNNEKKCVKIDYFLNRNYIYKVDVIKGTKYYQYYTINEDKYSLNEKITFINASESEPVKILETDVELKQKTIYEKNNEIVFEDESKIIETDLEEINEFISNIIIEYLKKQKWNVLFWKYEEKNILPSEIKTEDFVNNPDSCLPLKKLFELYGISDIKKEYDLKKSTSRSNSFENLLNKISIKSTDYLRKKWKTMPKDTKIVLNESGENIRISIEDSKNKYDMLDRSDGYKRLLSFLILISIDNTNSILKNSLLLIDCPEAEIDIPGQKYLRDELIEIGKNNYVFYSTHSPYMIDSNNIFRHYIVSKEDEITNIKSGEEANYNDSTILFNALGTSLFENVSNLNIAFEGWSDKQLYYTGKKLLTASQKNKLENVGICQLGGLRNVNAFASTWQLICRVKKYVILSDSDETGLQSKNKFLEEHLNENVDWLTYSDLVDSDKKIETAEDFLTPQHIKDICDKYIQKSEDCIPISLEKLQDITKSNMSVIEDWLKQFGYEKEKYKTEKNKIKEALFTNLKKSDIISEYKNILEKIIELNLIK